MEQTLPTTAGGTLRTAEREMEKQPSLSLFCMADNGEQQLMNSPQAVRMKESEAKCQAAAAANS